jgi:hypothetical protein
MSDLIERADKWLTDYKDETKVASTHYETLFLVKDMKVRIENLEGYIKRITLLNINDTAKLLGEIRELKRNL